MFIACAFDLVLCFPFCFLCVFIWGFVLYSIWSCASHFALCGSWIAPFLLHWPMIILLHRVTKERLPIRPCHMFMPSACTFDLVLLIYLFFSCVFIWGMSFFSYPFFFRCTGWWLKSCDTTSQPSWPTEPCDMHKYKSCASYLARMF